MLITRTSILSGETRSIEINVTPDQMAAYERGVLVQSAFPNLSPDEREFILTGITADEWEKTFGD